MLDTLSQVASETADAWASRIGKLMEYVIEEDFILVTRNAQDFRDAGATDPGGLHAVAQVHAGLICLDGAGFRSTAGAV